MDLHLDHDDVLVNSPQAKAPPSQDGQSNTHATLIASDHQDSVAKSGKSKVPLSNNQSGGENAKHDTSQIPARS
ncbi:uncharacterized protein N7484_003705 [Penicillium longicatenatum]|uniref:uncharacterized protein n=1 Tax=Penicillium longicatenatum TaxID=1561947 RepID=UPI002547CEB9|nr:uncharacterized protein N7484_003705 [Penicillium longicatenatum]KAJ5649982.1 hypothetical protein N7484_003705 [Penicillium longicatenatum]